ncbi:MAG: GNAT family N-acetyltransferase [Pyrinomonadaceae bacterium]
MPSEIDYRIHPSITSDELNTLFEAVWDAHIWVDLLPVLSHSLTYVAAYRREMLIGFVNIAWDGGEHAFLLDTAVHRDYRRIGLGRGLVERAIAETRRRGPKWLHVDFEPHLEKFYREAGFRDTRAGLIRLKP